MTINKLNYLLHWFRGDIFLYTNKPCFIIINITIIIIII